MKVLMLQSLEFSDYSGCPNLEKNSKKDYIKHE